MIPGSFGRSGHGLGIGNSLVHRATDRVTFTLSRDKLYPNAVRSWKAEFYRNGKPVDDFANDATPFPKSYKSPWFLPGILTRSGRVKREQCGVLFGRFRSSFGGEGPGLHREV
jgi:hypothetical protein